MDPHAQLDLHPMPRLRRLAARAGIFSGATGPLALARAPGRLDVMGGVADYSGSLVCELPLSIAAGAAVQRRDDGRIVCRSAQEADTVDVPAALLRECDPLAVRRALSGPAAWARYAVGCAWWLSRRCPPVPALTILIDSDVPLGGGVSSSAAIEVATMTALCSLLGVTMAPLELAVACQSVENHVVGAPCGVMDQVTSAMGQADSMLEILCQPGPDGLPAQVLGQVQVPSGYTFIGIHSGVRHEVSGDPYTDTRVAAFMGQKVLSTLAVKDPTNGCLARVDLERYRGELRGRLPESIVGSAFLEQYGGTHDRVTTVRPEKTYTVRAATDHGVYEHARVSRFVALLKQASADRTGAAGLMRQAGALMLESHRSYSDCANLGHAMTDKLVELVGTRSSAGLLGAKITGGGCGGTVAVLLRDTREARDGVEGVRDQYTRETGRTTLLFNGSGPGAAAWGHQTIRFEDLP